MGALIDREARRKQAAWAGTTAIAGTLPCEGSARHDVAPPSAGLSVAPALAYDAGDGGSRGPPDTCRESPLLFVLPIPFRDPVAAFAPFAGDRFAALLDSAVRDEGRGRWAYIAAEPFRVIEAREDGVRVDGMDAEGDPFAVLERELAAHPAPDGGPAPFCGGAVGFFGYELGRHLERLPEAAADPLAMPEMAVGLYDAIAAFDLDAGDAFIVSTGLAEPAPDRRAARARERAEALAARLGTRDLAEPDWRVTGDWRAEQERAAVERAIARVIDYIWAGDIFQANMTQRVLARMPAGLDDFTLYRRLRAASPAPFAAFLRCGPDLCVASASPERFLQLGRDGHVETRPIKGTRPRGADPERDAALAAELLASEKDRAENLMIVDLLRNDIGRVCRLGSVRVSKLCGLESFASVHHLVSVVEGQLLPEAGPVDLLRACFPGGSITGAPKIRAMEIIRELEPARRGVYCGAIGWIGFDGAMDSSIVIRTLTRAGDTLIAQAGGGIVADSDPAAEYEESMVKMRAMLRALTGPNP